MKDVVVTGGAGFIGLRVCKYLLEYGYRVHCVDNLYTGVGSPEPLNGLEFYNLDIRDGKKIEQLMGDYSCDGVIHLAAIHHIPTCEQNPSLAMEVNVVGTQNVLNAMKVAGVNHIVLASSGAVYDWNDMSLAESAAVKPNDVYSISKFTNENQGRVWSAAVGGKVVSARIFNTIGHDDPNGHLIPDILSQLGSLEQDSLIKLGNVEPRRDYIHADDTARALVASYRSMAQFKDYEVLNVCSGEEYSVRDIVSAIGEALGINIEIQVDPERIRKIDRPSQLGSNNKIKELCNWAPEHNFNAAIRLTLSGLMDRYK